MTATKTTEISDRWGNPRFDVHLCDRRVTVVEHPLPGERGEAHQWYQDHGSEDIAAQAYGRIIAYCHAKL